VLPRWGTKKEREKGDQEKRKGRGQSNDKKKNRKKEDRRGLGEIAVVLTKKRLENLIKAGRELEGRREERARKPWRDERRVNFF